MKKFALLLLFFMSLKLMAQDRYIVEYQYSEKDGANKKTFTLYRDGDKIKFKGLDKYGNTVTMWAFKDEKNIYTLTENSATKIGTKYKGMDCSYIGMQWGVYILDLDNCDFLLGSSTPQGAESVAGKECSAYNIMQQGDIRTDYYIYDNKLMLKRTAPTTTIEATSFNDNPTFSADEFTLPAGIEWQ
jgi:hypothetical protein